MLLLTFLIFCSDKLKIQTRLNWVWIFYLVEVRGIEPLSKEVSSRGATSVVNG